MKRLLSIFSMALVSSGPINAYHSRMTVPEKIERAIGSAVMGYVTGLVPVVGQVVLLYYVIMINDDGRLSSTEARYVIVNPALAGHAAGIATLGYGTYKLMSFALHSIQSR